MNFSSICKNGFNYTFSMPGSYTWLIALMDNSTIGKYVSADGELLVNDYPFVFNIHVAKLNRDFKLDVASLFSRFSSVNAIYSYNFSDQIDLNEYNSYSLYSQVLNKLDYFCSIQPANILTDNFTNCRPYSFRHSENNIFVSFDNIDSSSLLNGKFLFFIFFL